METFKVAYILLRFPALTETFVADEIREIQQQGIRVHLYSLLPPRQESVHPRYERLAQQVSYAPEIYSWQLWRPQLSFFIRAPLIYLVSLIRLIRQPYPHAFMSLFLKRMLIFLKAVALAYELKSLSVQVLHTHFAWLSGAATSVISNLLRIPFTVTVHAYDIFALSDLLCLTAQSASRIIAISEYNKQTVLELCPELDKDSVIVIHCGVGLQFFAPEVRAKQQGPLSILSVGSLIEKKGHAYLIQACQQLKLSGIEFRCAIIGRGPDEENLRQLIQDCELNGRVTLEGALQRDDILAACSRSDIFVLASVVARGGDRDGIPVVLMEALAMQLPVISTQVSGIPELVRHLDTGWLVPQRNAKAIADAIAHLADDNTLRAHLGQNGRVLVEREFNITENAKQLVDVLRDVSKQPSV